MIDAAGKIVSPGFIHIDCTAISSSPRVARGDPGPVRRPGDYDAGDRQLRVFAAPVDPLTRAELSSYTTFLRAGDLPDAWTGFGDYLNYLDGHGLMLNVVPMVAHGACGSTRWGSKAAS